MNQAYYQAQAWGVKTKNGVLTPLNCTARAKARKLCYKGAKAVKILVTLVEILPEPEVTHGQEEV